MRVKGGDVLLSPRDAEVATLLYSGRTNAEIAVALGLSGNSVSSRIAGMLRDLELTSRSGLVLWCAQHPGAVILRQWSDYKLHPLGCDCTGLPYCCFVRGQVGVTG